MGLYQPKTNGILRLQKRAMPTQFRNITWCIKQNESAINSPMTRVQTL